MKCAPVALFVYNRISHTKETITSLEKNYWAKETDLYIFSDAAKEGDENAVREVREYIDSISPERFKSVTVISQNVNKGLAKSVIDGITRVLETSNNVIVLEDDLVSCPSFLSYMNVALDRYERCDEVYAISGYSYFAENDSMINKTFLPSYYFLSCFCSWGWGTWKDRWNKFDQSAEGWEKLKTDRKLSYEFSLEGALECSEMLIEQMTKGIDSWAIRWWWTIFCNKGLTLFPRKSFIANMGMDGTGIHGVDREVVMELAENLDNKMPKEVAEKRWVRKRLVRHFKSGFLIGLEWKFRKAIAILYSCGTIWKRK